MSKWLQLHGFPPSDKHYDFTRWATAIGCEWGVPLSQDRRLLAMEMLDKVGAYVAAERTHLLSSTFRMENAASSWSTSVALRGDMGHTVGIAEFDCVLAPLIWYLCPYLQSLKQSHPKMKLVLLEDDAFQEMALCHANLSACVYGTIALADAVLCYSEDMYKWVNGFHPRCRRVTLPLPSEFAAHQPDEALRDQVSLGILSWNYDLANIHANCLVFAGLPEQVRNENMPSVVGARSAPWYAFRDLSSLAREVPGIKIASWHQEDFYSYLGKQSLVIHLTRRSSMGRYSAQCAWTGTPIIGNAACTWQKRLWPRCSVDPHELEKARDLAYQILDNERFRTDLVAEASGALRQYVRDQDSETDKILSWLSDGGIR